MKAGWGCQRVIQFSPRHPLIPPVAPGAGSKQLSVLGWCRNACFRSRLP